MIAGEERFTDIDAAVRSIAAPSLGVATRRWRALRFGVSGRRSMLLHDLPGHGHGISLVSARSRMQAGAACSRPAHRNELVHVRQRAERPALLGDRACL